MHDHDINESLELLYSSPEDAVRGINQVLSLLGREPRDTLESVVRNHQLMSALARLLGDDSYQPIEMIFSLGKLFLSLTLIEDFHQILSNHRVGALALGLVELEVKRARHRECWSTSPTVDSAEPSNSVIDPTSRSRIFSKKQERVLFIFLSILDNLADDPAVLKKMMKKSLVGLLVKLTHQKSSQNLIVTLSILNKSTALADISSDIMSPECRAISQLTSFLSVSQHSLVHESLTTLFNMSFHQECLSLISAENIHFQLVSLLQKNSLCGASLKLMYRLTLRDEDRRKFHEAKFTPYLLKLLLRISPDEELDRSVAGLLVNVSAEPFSMLPGLDYATQSYVDYVANPSKVDDISPSLL
jgi:hypothetical protein